VSTDAELRDQIEAELKQTTVGFINSHWKVPPPGTHWANVFTLLPQIGAAYTPPAGGLDPRYPAALHALYNTWAPPASPTQEIATQAALDALAIKAGDWVVVKPLQGGAAYTGQHDWNWQLPRGQISAKIQFEPGVLFRGTPTSYQSVISCIAMTGTTGLLLEGPADVANPGWNPMKSQDCKDVIVRGMICHDSATGGFGVSADTTGAWNVWLVDGEAYNNGHQAACWDGYGQNAYLKSAHGINMGDGSGHPGSVTAGGGVVGMNVHDQHVGYGLQVYGALACAGLIVDFNRFTNIDGKVSGVPPVVGTASDEAGCGIMVYGAGVTNLFVGPNNIYSGCAFTDFALEAGATLAPGSAQPTYTA